MSKVDELKARYLLGLSSNNHPYAASMRDLDVLIEAAIKQGSDNKQDLIIKELKSRGFNAIASYFETLFSDEHSNLCDNDGCIPSCDDKK
jgi:hypothetical protein